MPRLRGLAWVRLALGGGGGGALFGRTRPPNRPAELAYRPHKHHRLNYFWCVASQRRRPEPP